MKTPKVLKLTAAPEPTEAELQSALLLRLHRRGWVAVRVNSGARKTTNGGFFRAYIVTGAPDASAGFPDVLAMRTRPGCAPELRLFEVKRRGGKRSDAQERFAAFALARGITVEVVARAAGLDALEI